MNNKSKKALALIAAGVMTASMLAGCTKPYTGSKLPNTPAKEATVTSNGGFAVQKGDYVYFINGMEDYTASNEYGEVVKGALMRVRANEIGSGTAETVVPMLFTAQNFDAGIYIYGEYVYFATPTTDKNMDGNVENSWIDFKRAKLDGTEAMKDYYFRLSNNAANYRFVEEDGVVYCLYEEDGALKSFNTDTRKTTVLVSGAKSSFFYDESDPESGNVYYTMSVVTGADSDYSATASYDQLYCVNASAKVEKVDANKASYTVKGGKTYDFDENYLKEQNKAAKDNKTDEPYDLSDYTTYPYVNLGKLVLDGIGVNSHEKSSTQFNSNTDTTPATPDGYNYTISGYKNGGVYFTRSEVTKTSSSGENTNLYYLADADKDKAEWNVVKGNEAENLDVVAPDTTNTSSALLYIDEKGNHCYLYIDSASDIVRVSYNAEGNREEVHFKATVSGATLWKLEGNYLYFWQSFESGNGNNIQRINYKGSQADYTKSMEFMNDDPEYQPLQVKGVDWNSSWYEPEIFGDKLLYSNEQTFGLKSYNYIYTAALGTTAQIVEKNEAYDKVEEYIDEYADVSSSLQGAMRYYFRSGRTEEFEAVRDLYDAKTEDDKTEADEFDAFVKKFTDGEFKKESYFYSHIGKIKSEDSEEIDESWVSMLRTRTTEETEDDSLSGLAIALIVVGSVLVVAAAVLIPTLIVIRKKKAAAEAEATVNAYKRKIDTTDDKTIDVYADESEEETKAEEAEETQAEPVAEAETEAEATEQTKTEETSTQAE